MATAEEIVSAWIKSDHADFDWLEGVIRAAMAEAYNEGFDDGVAAAAEEAEMNI